MPYRSHIVHDSISTAGKRITTVEVTYPRFVHSELLTHRSLSRNSSSSRAIPVARLMKQVSEDPAMPVYWGRNQRGMQAGGELEGEQLAAVKAEWLAARDRALASAEVLSGLELHKQIVNRILEPWMFITVLVTATEWDNFFGLRCHPAAQPEIRRAAEMMRDAMAASTPVGRDVHLPFVRENDLDWCKGGDGDAAAYRRLRLLSVARCARVSYLTHDGVHSPAADLDLAERLSTSGHWSPFEHVAEAMTTDPLLRSPGEYTACGNFRGWKQFRKDFAGESGVAASST